MNTFSAPTHWPYQHPSYPPQPSHPLSTNLRNKLTGSNPPPFQPKTVSTKSTDHGLAKQKQEQKIRMKHLTRMLSLGPPPPPPLAAPASRGQSGRRSRGGRRPPGSGCGGGSVLNSRLGRVYGQQVTSEGETVSRHGDQTEARTEENVDNWSGVKKAEHSTKIPPPDDVTSSVSSSLLNIGIPPPRSPYPPGSCPPPPPSSYIKHPSSDLPSPSSFPIPPPTNNLPASNSCPPSGSFPPLAGSCLTPLGKCPPPDSCHPQQSFNLPPPIPISNILPPAGNSPLYTRRPTQTVKACDWKPMRTVDYESVWVPGVVTEYREKVEGVFQPEMFDYESVWVP